ncbi:unnamed protein product [Parnassius apollo]|uniref:beta-glucosidase n=1 Tax=Parnassius apollo TaxID=110799 RepID=A0A8S3XWG2_PARAO|nr:unnamed protein product [Parnassius apollo]
MPQRLQDLGGWTNPLIVEWFADYARVAYTLYADRVKAWITINEPAIVCDFVYNSGIMAPPIKDPGFANYLCAKFILLAHAKAWRIYDEEFKPMYNGKVGITNHLIWLEPFSDEYEELTENLRHQLAGLYSHPIYTKDGGWPSVIEKIIAEKSKSQGYPRSRLPAFTQEEIDFIKGTYDFYGFNFYTSRLVRKARDGETLSNWPMENGCPELSGAMEVHPSWGKTESEWFWSNPVGIRKMLGWLKKTYGDMEFFITENGLATKGYKLNDEDRIKYYRDHLEQEPANYEFSYKVSHYKSGSDFGRAENWQDDKAEGTYFVVFPNGTKQVVEYEADEDGFKSRISVIPVDTAFSGAGDGTY